MRPLCAGVCLAWLNSTIEPCQTINRSKTDSHDVHGLRWACVRGGGAEPSSHNNVRNEQHKVKSDRVKTTVRPNETRPASAHREPQTHTTNTKYSRTTNETRREKTSTNKRPCKTPSAKCPSIKRRSDKQNGATTRKILVCVCVENGCFETKFSTNCHVNSSEKSLSNKTYIWCKSYQSSV